MSIYDIVRSQVETLGQPNWRCCFASNANAWNTFYGETLTGVRPSLVSCQRQERTKLPILNSLGGINRFVPLQRNLQEKRRDMLETPKSHSPQRGKVLWIGQSAGKTICFDRCLRDYVRRSPRGRRYSPAFWETLRNCQLEPVDILRLKVSGALAAGDTLITINAAPGDPTATNPGYVWGVATHLVPGDILMVEPATSALETQAFTYEYIKVTQVVSSLTFVAQRGVMGSTAGVIANDAFLLKIGSRYEEGTAEPKSASRNPIKYFNYCQIFKTGYEVSKSAAQTKARTGDPLKNDRKRKAFDHARDLEFSLLFGRKNETTGLNGKPERSFDGIRRFIPAQNVTIFTGAVSFTAAANNFFEATYRVFDYDTEAGDERIAICGNIALNEMNKIVAATTGININMDEVITMYGMNLRKVVLPQGVLYLRTHPLLNRHAIFSKSIWLLDFSALKWRYLQGRDTDFEDNIQSKGEDVVRGQWLTEAGLEVKYGGLSLGYLGNVTAT